MWCSRRHKQAVLQCGCPLQVRLAARKIWYCVSNSCRRPPTVACRYSRQPSNILPIAERLVSLVCALHRPNLTVLSLLTHALPTPTFPRTYSQLTHPSSLSSTRPLPGYHPHWPAVPNYQLRSHSSEPGCIRQSHAVPCKLIQSHAATCSYMQFQSHAICHAVSVTCNILCCRGATGCFPKSLLLLDL